MGEAAGKAQGVAADEARYNAEIGRRIEGLRKRRGVSRLELAKATGMSRQNFYKCEAGIVRWRPHQLRLIADYFRVPVVRFIPETNHYGYNPAAPQELF